ncbi:hypothetical protein TREAZ_0912 [Leadbettera azotonutricia ZAS-9]|uniref:DUF8091 domain-containing protein n=2 Tax=Leadbettera azotonutricia TaxID=150829 RepID=F5Y8X2_LEAAZ|nr:hypothetical protein TREAZ_0912 [Leadbettera azotonutricia ZAS-9]
MLKFRYGGEGGQTEAPIGDYVCDARTEEGELIEVQTGSFGPLKEKAKALAKKNKLRIIHPIVLQKTIELYDTKGTCLRSRKSPRKGSPWDIFKVLLYAPELPLVKNLTIELALIDINEKRIDDGKGSWRRKKATIADKSLSAWHSSIILSSIKDYARFIPYDEEDTFTVKDFAQKTKINTTLAQKTLYTLTRMSLVTRIGKQGNSYLYQKSKKKANKGKKK